MDDDNSTSCQQLKLPGFRFHPTEEELLNFYLKSTVSGKRLRGGGGDIIGYLNIYNHHPWELPGLAKIGEREWFFFVPRDKKHGSGGRPNRTTQNGFWKATGSDRKIVSISDPKKLLGLRKTLVFYEGRAPRGTKTDWIMNEYRLPPGKCSPQSKGEDIVLCKIYRKATSLKVLEQMAAMEQQQQEEEEDIKSTTLPMEFNKQDIKAIEEDESSKGRRSSCSTLMLPNDLADLQVPKFNTDWTQDSFWTQLNSPWLDNLPHFLQMY